MRAYFRFIIFATVALFVIVSVQPAAAQSGPVAAYAFNEGTGTTAADATGNGRTGTLSGATWTTSGRFGGALTFNGTSARVNVADHALLDLTTGMTLQAWVYPTALGSYRTVILKERPGDLAYALYANENTARPSTWIMAGTSASAAGTAALPLNTWTHLAATYDGAVLRMYVNSVEVGSQARSGSIFVSASPLRIGGNAIWGEYFQGRIDEVRIYARALSAAEILTDMNTPVAPIDSTPPIVAVTSPLADTTVAGTIDLSATASDNIAVVGVQFLIDGTPAGAEDTSNPYVVTFDTRTLTNALHQVTARARDAAGNTTTSAAVPITASNPPRLVITSPVPGANISGTTIPVTYTITGDLSGFPVDHLHLQLDGGPELPDHSVDGAYDLFNVAPGAHVLNGWLVRGDHSKIPGTDATPVNFTTTLPDTTAPTVEITAPGGGATVNETIQVDATASDNVGVVGVQFLLDGAALGAEDTAAPYSVSWSTLTTPNGSHVLAARARDAAGNTTTSADVTITVANTGPPNLVAGYAFDEGSGTTAADVSGNGLNGTLSAATWTTSGRFGGALSFNGTSALVTVADHALLDLTTGMTLQAWVYPTTLSGYRTVMLKERPGDLAYALYAHDGAPRPSAWITAGTPATATGTAALPLNTWTHLATTYDGAVLRLYVNGVQVGSQTHSGSLFVSGNPLRIGGNTIWGEYFAGRLDEVRVYSRALSAAEIQTSMNNPLSAPPPPPPTTWSISGSITPSSAGSGATVSVTGAGSATTTADVNGNYTVSGLSNGAYTVTPSKGGFTFAPVNRSVSINGANMSGINFTGTSTTDPAVVGQWAPPFEMGVVAVNMVLLHTGSVLFYSGTFATTGIERVWNPTTGNFTDVPLGRTNLFCSAHSQLSDGRILVIGGHEPQSGLLGSRDVNIFDPVTQSWTPGPSMTDPRWYPTSTTLADGRVLATSGGTTCLTCIADVPEIYNPVTNSWSGLTGARLAFPYYPFIFLLPDGRVVDAGANESAVATRTLDVATQTWTMIDPIVVDGHSAAMYRPGKIIKSGTATDSGKTGTAAATAYVIDMNQPSPTWRQVPSMANARAFHNTVVLPTGDVLVTGGGTRRDGYDGAFAIREAELWSPVTETWRTLSAMQFPRLYHSGALLLPDARVLIAGGGNDGPAVNYTQGEIFSPPYLFKGPRPVITSTPPQAQYASTFVVDTPDAANITGVSLMRPGAVTHAFDEDARFLSLTFEVEPGRIVVHAPQNANLAPPGYYMLFLLAGEVPSTAAFIRLPSPADDTAPPSPPSNLNAVGGVGTATLSWTASTDDTGVTAYNVHRSTAPGIVPTTANRIARTSATGFVDSLPGGSYYYVVTAEDANVNVSTPSNETGVTVLEDVTPPSVAITVPADGAQVSGIVAITATASDDIGVVGVQFELDQTPLGAEDTSAPYTFNWPTTSAANGVHLLTAVARDAQGHQTRSAVITVTVSNDQTPSGLVAAYGFNELTGSTAADASGNGNSGQINNAVWSTAGRYGGALQFNGASSMVSVNDAASLDLTTGMTLSAWVNPTQLSGWRTVIMKEQTGDLTYVLYAHDEAPHPAGYVSVPNQVSVAGTSALALNNWSHLAVTYDGASLALFVNGTEVQRLSASGSMGNSSSMLRIGGNSIWGEYFSGLIDEVRVYNRALTATEIQTDMNTPVGGS